MAKELQLQRTSGQTVYGLITALDGGSAGQIWNGAAFEAIAGGNYATYAVLLSEPGTIGIYEADFPALPAGWYGVCYRQKLTGSYLATDTQIGSDALLWSGAAVVRTVSVVDYTTARAAKLDSLDAAVSSRLATSGYTAPPSAGSIASAVWDALVADHIAAGSTGEALRLIRERLGGHTKISNGQLLIYAPGTTTVIATLNLLPAGGPFSEQVPA